MKKQGRISQNEEWLTATIMLAAHSRAAFPLFSIIPPFTDGVIVRANNDTIDRRFDGSCSIVEVKSTLATVDAPRWPPEWSVSLCLLWQLSSSLTAGHKAVVKPSDSTARLFSEEGSSPDLRFFSPTAGLSLCLGGVALACYSC